MARLRNGVKQALPEKAIFRSVTVYYIYNIVVLTVNIEFMWRGLETRERRKTSLTRKPIFRSVTVYYKNLSSQYNLTIQIEPVQDQMFSLSNNVICM